MPQSWGLGDAVGFRANTKIQALGPILLARLHIFIDILREADENGFSSKDLVPILSPKRNIIGRITWIFDCGGDGCRIMSIENKKGETTMAISNAVQRGAFVYVYDEKGRAFTSIPAGNGPKDGLKGYTSSTVNVQRGSFTYTYDERGRCIRTTPAR